MQKYYSIPKKAQNILLYYLVRFYFIFFPANLLLIKLSGVYEITYWKDIAYIICFISGLRYFIANKYSMMYLVLIALTIILQFLHNFWYFEYLAWLIMGTPLILYVGMISMNDYTKDCTFIGIIIVTASIWIFFFESGGGYGDFFIIKLTEQYTPIRDDLLRIRFFFPSPMSFSQYCWFSLILFFSNPRLNFSSKFLFISAATYNLLICNTRAGILLLVISITVFAYTSVMAKPRKLMNLFIIIFFSGMAFYLMAASASNSLGNVSTSDELRLFLLTFGIESIQQNFLFGVGGEVYSPRYPDWINFENSFFNLINSFGFIGIIFCCWFVYLFMFKSSQKSIILFSIPWCVYSTIFPVLQEATSVYITWFILGLILHERKADLLFSKSEPVVLNRHNRFPTAAVQQENHFTTN